MTMTEFERLLDRDVDDLLDYARRLTGRARTAAFGDALSRLEQTKDDGTRIRILRFLQTLLADVPNGRLPASAAEPAAIDLSRIVSSSDEHVEARRAALDTLALLFLKAKELTPLADSRVRAAFHAASNARDAQLNSFARISLSPSGVLARRTISRRLGYVYFSGIAPAYVAAGRRASSVAATIVAGGKAAAATVKRRVRNASRRLRRDETQRPLH
jgi:hypothetical protein